MVPTPKTIKQTGLVQIILATTFVVWLVLFPSRGGRLAAHSRNDSHVHRRWIHRPHLYRLLPVA
jgi:hypothetical protein